MKLLNNKKILVFGVLNKNSIAYGISKKLFKNGAELAFVFKNKKIKNNVFNLIKEINNELLFVCDLSNNKEINFLKKNILKFWLKFDGFVFSISHSNKNLLNGNYIEKINKKDFIKSYEINVYSLIYIIKIFYKLLNNNSSILVLSYLASNRVLENYNILGPIKASLESNVKYICYSLSKISNCYIRINSISPGPISTTSSYSIKNFKNLLDYYKKKTPYNKLVTLNDIGNISSFLMSDMSIGINGENIFIDNGFNFMI